MLVVERNFTEFSGEFARDYFRKCHEPCARVGSHGEARFEGYGTVNRAHQRPEDEGAAAVESDDWLNGDSSRRVLHEIFSESP
jgi:hypothetical protein